MNRKTFLSIFLSSALTLSAQINTSSVWMMMPEKTYDYIVGEASGERALRSIMEMASYERNRTHEEYNGTLHEIAYMMKMLQAYGLDNVRLENVAKADTWDGISASLWEVSPKLKKIADYDELTAFLASGSENSDVEAELVWVSLERIRGGQPSPEVNGKIVFTDAPISQGHAYAQANGGVGVVSFYAPRPLFDPLQMPNSGIASYRFAPSDSSPKTLFGFNITPRQGYELKSRLLNREKIVVQAKVQTGRAQFDVQAPSCSIPGSDPTAGSIIFSAHLFEGYVKLGANDNTSGCAVILEVARTLKTLIDKGLIERPKRTLHFVWGAEFAATAPWASLHKEITDFALCNINLDMVGINLKHNNASYTLHRTTYGNPHYVNDVAENFFYYMAETNRNSILSSSGRDAYIKPVVAPSGSDDNFPISISEHFGSSDHEVFNDWGIQVPGVMMITWPDMYYHTSQDRVDKMDATQLKRATVLAAATAYTIASAGEEGALRIGAEVMANANKRLSFYQTKYIDMIANAKDVEAAFRHTVFAIEGHAKNEKNTLATILELTPENKKVSDFIQKGSLAIDKTTIGITEALKLYAEIRAGKSLKIGLTPEEVAASKRFYIQTSKPTEMRYGVMSKVRESLSAERRTQVFGKLVHPLDIARMTNSGTNSVLDIHKMVLAQNDKAPSIDAIILFLELLEEQGYVKVIKK